MNADASYRSKQREQRGRVKRRKQKIQNRTTHLIPRTAESGNNDRKMRDRKMECSCFCPKFSCRPALLRQTLFLSHFAVQNSALPISASVISAFCFFHQAVLRPLSSVFWLQGAEFNGQLSALNAQPSIRFASIRRLLLSLWGQGCGLLLGPTPAPVREINHPLQRATGEMRSSPQYVVQSGFIQSFQAVSLLPCASLQDRFQGEHERLQFGVHSGKTCLSSSSACASGIRS